jgi:stalled ribosome rescue protein Dom34
MSGNNKSFNLLKLKSKKHIGIWMDHSIAHLVEFKLDTIVSYSIESETNGEEKQNFGNDESLKHNKEKNQLLDYFAKLTQVIKNYEEVLLFGPTEAKNELFNLLRGDRHFKETTIELKTVGKLTEKQLQAFVKDHYSTSN